MTYFKKNVKHVNGPVNVVRMEGAIEDVKKVIYIFMDQHLPITEQLECDNIFAKDINSFFVEKFNNLNDSTRMYDFFLEIMPSKTQNISHGFFHNAQLNFRDIYLIEVWKIFRKIFKYNPESNKVFQSKYFRNVRLHYIDVRDYFEGIYFENIFQANNIARNMINNQEIGENDINRLISILSIFKKYCELIIIVIKKYKKSVKKQPKKIELIKHTKKNQQQDMVSEKMDEKSFLKDINYIINKIFTKYNHNSIKEKLLNQLDVIETYFMDLLSNCEYLTKEFLSIFEILHADSTKLRRDTGIFEEYLYGLPHNMILKYIFFINDNLDILSNKASFFFTRFMDVYFLRRFLDKDYITNAITYTGSYHSAVYIEILSHDFNFKITHFSYAKIPELKKLNAEIKKRDAIALEEIFYPSTISQCSNLTNFPEDFL